MRKNEQFNKVPNSTNRFMSLICKTGTATFFLDQFQLSFIVIVFIFNIYLIGY